MENFFVILLLHIADNVYSNSIEKVQEFLCIDGTKINLGRVCDGIVDCPDSSDEIRKLCHHVLCPSSSYRCNYGACIDKSLRCNGFQDCLDESDEFHCDMKETCSNHEYRCFHSLECISLSKTCDDFKSITCTPLNSRAARQRCEALWGPHQGWISCNGSIPVGTHVTLECPEYYERESGSYHSTCLHDGTWSQVPLQCQPICGLRETSALALIVKGWKISSEDPLPWHATLFSHDDGQWVFFCGGTLISERIVLTAGHCVWKTDTKTIRVILGGFSSNFSLDQEDKETQVFDIFDIKLHRSYHDHEGNYGSDLAALVLNESAIMSFRVKPVCLNWSADLNVALRESGEIGLVGGMGITENDTFSKYLRVTTVKLIDENECRESQKRDFRRYLTYTTFCAGWNNGTAVCNGDSGGGLALQRPNTTIWDLHGIVSISPRKIGTSICDPQYYTVFTKIVIYSDWIDNILREIPVVGPPDLLQIPNHDFIV